MGAGFLIGMKHAHVNHVVAVTMMIKESRSKEACS
jgi:hypothetical protein